MSLIYPPTTKEFKGKNGKVTELVAVKVEHRFENNKMVTREVPNSTFSIKADLVLLAMGFVHPIHKGLLEQLGVDLDERGNVAADTESYTSTQNKVFACGDMRRGQSLVVWAIREGRQCAREVDMFLMGETALPR